MKKRNLWARGTAAALPAAVFAAGLLLGGCASAPGGAEAVVEGMDELIGAISRRTVELLDTEAKSTLAVYYFTVEDRESGISDYLINDLSTTIANLGGAQVDVVTRQALDRILSEYSFQLSDLADKEKQVLVGEQLGADLILTGFITPVADAYRLNAQLIHVKTGVVKGGFILGFRLEKDFARRIAGADAVSRTVAVEEQAVTRTGVATLTTLLETFDAGTSTVRLGHYEDYYGEGIRFADTAIGMEAEGSEDGSPCVRFDFTAELASPFSPSAWEESYLVFYFDMGTDWKTTGYDGLHLSLNFRGFSFADIILKQRRNDEELMFGLPVYLSPDGWHDVRIPFYDFYPFDSGESLDPEMPITVSVAVPYEEGSYRYDFHDATEIAGSILADNIGLFRITGAEGEGLLESFDDEISRMVVVPELYGSLFYWDYSQSDDGELKKAVGIENPVMSVERRQDGPSGDYLSVRAALDVTEEFRTFVETECCLSLFLRARIGKEWSGFDTLSFSMRAEGLTEGCVEITDNRQELYFEHDITLTPIWTKLLIPFSEFASDRRTLADLKGGLRQPYLTMCFDVPQGALRRALNDGRLEISVDMDEFVLFNE